MKRISLIRYGFVIVFLILTGCLTNQPRTEAQQTELTEVIISTPAPTHAQTQAETATQVVSTELADGAPEKFLQNLNEVYKKYEHLVGVNPVNAGDLLSPDGRYLALQYFVDEDLLNFSIFDIQENQQVDIPINLVEFDDGNLISIDSWSLDGSSLFMKVAPVIGLYEDTSLLLIQSIDNRKFAQYLFPYPEDTLAGSFTLNQDGSHLIFRGGHRNYNKFFVIDINTNLITKYSLPEGVFPKEIFYFDETNFLIRYYLDEDDDSGISELSIVYGSTGKSEVVYHVAGDIDIIDYDPIRELVLIRNGDTRFYFIDAKTWSETTFFEEDALFGHNTKLIGNCLPNNFRGEDGATRAGLYNLLTGETKILGDYNYLGWYPFFENHLVLVENKEGDDWIEFLDVVCE